MDQTQAIKDLTSKARKIPQIQGLFLAGSFGRGVEDPYSDIDMVAVADTENHLAIETAWKEMLNSLWLIVFSNTRRFRSTLVNVITEDWLRIDLIVEPKELFARRAKSHTKLLFEHCSLYETLDDTLPAKTVHAGTIEQIINEFIRVLGLIVVVVEGRGEYVTGVAGAQMLRDQFARLLIETKALSDPGGALHMSRILSESDMALLQSIPVPQMDHTSIIKTDIETAKLFFPLARQIAAEHGAEWPEAFEVATQKYLQNALGDKFDVSWKT